MHRRTAAIALAQACDFALTAFALTANLAREAGPLATGAYLSSGLLGLAILKVLAIAASVGLIAFLDARAPAFSRVGLIVAVLSGLLPVVWNLGVLLGR